MQTWSLAEARAYLPRLRELLTLIDAALLPGAEPGTWGLPVGSEHAEAALEELSERGIILRQIGAGLVDFVWKSAGETRLLCWRTDEDELEWWHRPEDGFAGRRRIDQSSWPGEVP